MIQLIRDRELLNDGVKTYEDLQFEIIRMVEVSNLEPCGLNYEFNSEISVVLLFTG